MESTARSIPSTDSSSKSSQPGHLPGTPKPPMDPPRRRSSLFFQRVLPHTHSPKAPSASLSESKDSEFPLSRGSPSNVDQAADRSPMTRSIPTPGHVAQMQKLFQSAKASFRLDMSFAASPVGSIDARLPGSREDGSNGGQSASTCSTESRSRTANTPKDWRYSTAPRFIAEVEVDVREPFPDRSPQLPNLSAVGSDHGKILVAEPLSSGFTSPVNQGALASPQTEPRSPPHCDEKTASDLITGNSLEIALQDAAFAEELATADLQQPLRNLSMNSEQDVRKDIMDDSPIAMHLKKRPAILEPPHSIRQRDSADTISLSESAHAAAASAKIKRKMLPDLFLKPPTIKPSPESATSPGNAMPASHHSKADLDSCPDPSLHQRGPAVLCPDPTLHFKPSRRNLHGPESPSYRHHIPQAFIRGPTGLWNRATDTGSPVPLLKGKASAHSPRNMRRQSHETLRSTPHLHHPRVYPQQPDLMNRPRPPQVDEHFQPGWYYANGASQPQTGQGPMLYSFSTAAAKVIGQDPAPDSRIRDSYRTDTLTPLAKPPSRFRKNGILALAGSRGAGKYYGAQGSHPRAHDRHMHFNEPRSSPDVRFRSSPPRSSSDSSRPTQSRKRARETDSRRMEIFEDDAIREEDELEIDPKLKLEEDEEVIEVDEETRAAVRMSLYGTPPVESSMKELSPNVMAWRKGARTSGSRKKRRPSYWDGDLEEIVRNPAARHVVSSPIKKEVDSRSQQAEVEYDDEVCEGPQQSSEDELEDISRIAEGPTVLLEDVQMED
ncbi:uncharacterized protein A1O9_12784 [Exophiala aquamarina CBS 119918]|uniref:Uncharacterized protein n=1 Tax=Exophiala aquamarina CBS 119918 TaxID=1182545 RepID=A0A072P6C2_9EURO|nr:uncharacterized protein A1O9_12784 [Exophiala aquamarina CBS 119918]KEF51170.1 hypothetical protein A1O9_12784 [Exophiala aquamarina CBS 119918]